MMDRLWVKLTGAFALVILVGVAVTVVLARQGAATQFSHFMVGNQMLRPEGLQEVLADYYRQAGGWQEADAHLDQLLLAASSGGMMGGMMGDMMGIYQSRIRVVDRQGVVVADTKGPPGESLLPLLVERGWPIVVDGEQVGALIIDGVMMQMDNGQAQSLLAGVTRAVLIAGLIAGLVALILAGLLIRQITRPLTALSQASRRIAQGDLSARVPVHSRDELGQVASIFNQMAGALQSQESLRRQLVADVAHELRTPLSGIQGTVEALQDGIFPLTPENLTPIHQQVTMLNRLVEDLRTLAQAESGQLTLEQEPLSLEELAGAQVAAHLPKAQQEGVELRLHVADRLPRVWGDGQRLAQVLGNLLANGLRHTPRGGQVLVRLRPLGRGVELAVLDTGEGISPQDLPHIFDRFYRGDRSRSRATGGSGLGLAIARQLVEAHGGRIWAESPPPGQDRGSGFYVWLPSIQEQSPSSDGQIFRNGSQEEGNQEGSSQEGRPGR